MTYKLCKAAAKAGKLTAQVLDVYLIANRITVEQYQELLALITQ